MPSPEPKTNGVNGTSHSEADTIDSLRAELDTVNAERASLQTQYDNLLTKVSQMRSTLGKKLQEDADELDRQQTEIQALTDTAASLESTVTTLQSELESSVAECTSLTETLSRTTETLTQTQSELKSTGSDLRRTQQELRNTEAQLTERENEFERLRIESSNHSHSSATLSLELDELRTSYSSLESEVDVIRGQLRIAEDQREDEKREKENLKDVLADFQDMKDHELKLAVKDLDSQLGQVTQSLAEWKSRALNAELALDESKSSSGRVSELESQVKEKTALLNKSRHEAVILNGHLTEALRRLRQTTTATNTNVDRRLVSNVILQFLNIPRGDTKRFEVLTLLSTILEWSDQERERAGLARSVTPQSISPSTSGRGSFWPGRNSTSTADSIIGSEKGLDEPSESFSKLWVEFLLTEAAGDQPGLSPTGVTPPPSPGRLSLGSHPSSTKSASSFGRRLGSFGNLPSLPSQDDQ